MPDYLLDLEADFLVFYRIENIYDMPAVRFFNLARRCVAYPGAIRREWDIELVERQMMAEQAEQTDVETSLSDRVVESGGEFAQVPAPDEGSYIQELLATSG